MSDKTIYIVFRCDEICKAFSTLKKAEVWLKSLSYRSLCSKMCYSLDDPKYITNMVNIRKDAQEGQYLGDCPHCGESRILDYSIKAFSVDSKEQIS